MNYFTLRTFIILMETIKNLYKSPGSECNFLHNRCVNEYAAYSRRQLFANAPHRGLARCCVAKTIYFLGRPQMVEESGNTLVASPFQPLFHVRHAVVGSEQAPLNLWSIVLLTDARDPRYCEPFKSTCASRSAGRLGRNCVRSRTLNVT